ncbi:MAG TPA: hypothetical protein DDX71_05265 [Ruminococcus sp.]|nr:hypothetical protein [Ruminococcus sp.]
MAEYLDLYDDWGRPTGRRIQRGEPLPAGCRMLLVSVMTVNAAGEILLTRRAPEKRYAGKWEITAGCVQAGESAAEGAVRELREETGILVSEAELTDCGCTIHADFVHAFFLVHHDIPQEQVQLQAGETDGAQWVTPQMLLVMSEEGKTVWKHNTLIMRHFADVFRGCGI